MRLNYDLDVRHVLPVIQAPTLVLHRVADSLVPSDCGRYLAENITVRSLSECREPARLSTKRNEH